MLDIQCKKSQVLIKYFDLLISKYHIFNSCSMKKYQRQKIFCIMTFCTQNTLYICPTKTAFQNSSITIKNPTKQKTLPKLISFIFWCSCGKRLSRAIQHTVISLVRLFSFRTFNKTRDVSYPAVTEWSSDFKYLQPWILRYIGFIRIFLFWTRIYCSGCSEDKSNLSEVLVKIFPDVPVIMLI